MEFKRDDPKEVIKKVEMYEEYIKFLNSVKSGLEKFSKVSHFQSDVKQEIDEIEKEKNTYFKEQNCQHIKTTGLQYDGHDSHKDYFVDKCLSCGAEVNSDWT